MSIGRYYPSCWRNDKEDGRRLIADRSQYAPAAGKDNSPEVSDPPSAN
jgi:hypothetical protein